MPWKPLQSLVTIHEQLDIYIKNTTETRQLVWLNTLQYVTSSSHDH